MFEGHKAIKERALGRLGGVLVLIAVLLAYSNHFQNSFHFDDAHTIENNAAIREIGNIPRFFSDATTFSALPANQSYRPLVSTLLAVAYWVGGGLKPFWFHLAIFALFIVLVLLLVLVIERLLEIAAPASSNRWIALVAAGLYGLHPANADTVNYIIASSEVISTLGVIASFAVYFAFPKQRRFYFFALPAAIAVLAKPPAAIFAVLFAIYCPLFSPRNTRLAETRLQRLTQIAVPFFVCAAMLLFVQRMTPRGWIAGAGSTSEYLLTQPYVAWLYFKTFFWPVGLSADYDLNPFTTTDDARFWAGLTFTVLFITGAVIAASFRKTRLLGFGLLWFVIALLPTSLFPLAEVMNDHRTFLPYVGLAIALAGGASLVVQLRPGVTLLAKVAAGFAVFLLLASSAFATWERNKVWKTEESLWHDVTMKSPGKGRGLMNYGLTLMAKGNYHAALDYFHRAQKVTPSYSVLFVNLGIAEGALGRMPQAEQHFNEALRLAPSNPESYTFFARWLLAQSRASDALRLLRKAVGLAPSDLLARKLLAQAEKTVPAANTPESYLALSLQRYQEKRYPETIEACKAALALKPDYAEAWNNLCAACNQLGRFDEAVTACEQAIRCKPDFPLARNNLEYARQRVKPSAK